MEGFKKEYKPTLLEYFKFLFKKPIHIEVDHKKVIEDVLVGRGYVKDTHKGGVLYSKGFVYVLIKENVTIGHDIPSNKPLELRMSEVAYFIIALNNFERI